MQANGTLEFLYWVPAVGTGSTLAANNPSTIQWSSSAIAQSGYVYIFGAGEVTDSNDNTLDNTYLARIAAANIDNTNLWTFWDGNTWDVNENNAAPVSTNVLEVVRLYKGNWV